MSLQMDISDKRLMDDVLAFIRTRLQQKTDAESSIQGTGNYVHAIFSDAFQKGGLDEVDDLIDTVNESIKKSGGKEGLGEGAAFEHPNNDRPGYLHLSYRVFESGKLIARESIVIK